MLFVYTKAHYPDIAGTRSVHNVCAPHQFFGSETEMVQSAGNTLLTRLTSACEALTPGQLFRTAALALASVTDPSPKTTLSKSLATLPGTNCRLLIGSMNAPEPARLYSLRLFSHFNHSHRTWRLCGNLGGHASKHLMLQIRDACRSQHNQVIVA